MKRRQNDQLTAGDIVILVGVPQGLADDLPQEDQQAIASAVGTQVTFLGWDVDGRAEVQFEDHQGGLHFLYVAANFVKSA